MDPATIALIFGAAKTAYSAIQQGIKFGKDIQSMIGDVSKLYGSVAKLTQAAANPPKPKLFSKKSAEEIAIEIVTMRQQALEWQEQVKNEFVARYGLQVWDQVQRELIKVRKQQRLQEENARKDAEQFKSDLILLGSVILVGIIIVTLLVVTAIILS